MFIRQLGRASNPAMYCSGGNNCPAILELETGDFAVVGRDITDVARANLPNDSGCGDDERVVEIPRRLMIAARAEIPAH